MRNVTMVAIGVLQFLAPLQMIRASEMVIFRNPGDGNLRPWVVTWTRLEGAAFVAMGLGRDRIAAPPRAVFALFGVPALVAPRRFFGLMRRLVYADPDALEMRRGFVLLARLFGLAYLLLGIGRYPRKERDD